MKFTIVPVDSIVIVDGVALRLDAARSLPDDVHAVQWTGEAGWVEFKRAKGVAKAHQGFTDPKPYKDILNAHATAVKQIEARKKVRLQGELRWAPYEEAMAGLDRTDHEVIKSAEGGAPLDPQLRAQRAEWRKYVRENKADYTAWRASLNVQ